MEPKVLDNVGDLFNDLYYIYKDKYNEEKDSLNTKNKKYFCYRKLRLTDDYQCESEEEEEENNILVKSLIKNQQKIISKRYLKYRRPSDMLKDLYKINYKKKNSKLVDVIKSGLSDLKNETKNMDEKEKETEKSNEIIDVVEEIIEFNK